VPDIMPAASGGTIIPVVVAEPARHGIGQNVQVVEPMVGGTGARRGFDGADGRDSSISNLANNPVETVEAETGVEILRYGLRADSGGAGQWRGGCGQEIQFRILQDDVRVLARGMERLRFAPWGTHGGRPGARARLVLNPGTPDARVLGKIDVLPVNTGDVIALQTPGGGGWGSPFERAPDAVHADVVRGLVSIENARDVYGVVIDHDAVDHVATAQLRAATPAGTERGEERDRWDQVFEPALLDQLNASLFARPAPLRARMRQQVYAKVLSSLPADFPASPASKADLGAARALLQDAITESSATAA
jgi:N-methylhydantoinase B